MTKKPIVFPEVDTSGKPVSLMASGWPTLYIDSQKARERIWTELAERYEANPEDLYTAWMWLNFHPIFHYYSHGDRRHESTLCDDRGITEGLEFQPALVDKVTRKTGGDPANQELEIWVEVFPSSLTQGANDIRLHDVELDTGAPTYEEATIKVAALIYERHGHDRMRLMELWRNA